MAFVASNFQNQNSMSPGLGTYIYKSDTDTQATVMASGYFNNTDDFLNLAADDRIIVTGDQGGYELYVVSVTAGVVTTGLTSGGTGGGAPVLAGATLTLSAAEHNGRTIYWDQASGSVITLPAATGSGAKFRLVVSTTVTSNSHQLLCAGTDEYAGTVYQIDTDTGDAIAAYPALAADDFDDLDLNGTTTGGLIGDWVEVEDIATGVWAINGTTNATGVVATPLTST